MKSFFGSLLALFILMSAAVPSLAAETSRGVHVQGDGPHYLNLAVGTFEAFDDKDDALAAQVEFRFGQKLLCIGPLAGVQANLSGGIFGYAGIYLDLALGPFVLSPQTSIGAYEQGDSKELGGVFQFMSGLGLSWEFTDRSRLGFRYQHISNANLHDKNPGADILLLNYGIAL
ncbi:MAG TPA: acyloxyacyl hydrolase [Desulfuromonadales bacterium]|nr:acyloxyacyl hydrolase [Desulfuromonadales bacterium]